MVDMNRGASWSRAVAVTEPLGIQLKPDTWTSQNHESGGSAQLPDGTELPVLFNTSARWELVPHEPVRSIVIQPYINPRMAERYRERGVFYADLEGNAWIWTNSVKILVEGKRPSRETSSLARPGGLSTPSELRLTFVLLNDPSVVVLGLRAQADRAGISLGAAQNANRRLRDRGVITRDRELRRFEELTDDWLAGYSSRLLPKLRARTVSGADPVDAVNAIRRHTLDLTPAGEAVSETMDTQSSVTIYGTPPWTDLVQRLRLKPDPEGPITLRERFWNPEYVHVTDRGRRLLTCGEFLASTDERLRDSAPAIRQELT